MRILIVLLLFVAINLTAQEKPSFHSYELIIQPDHDIALSAWQAELTFDKKAIKLTGIEGGAKPFSEPADYDARGLIAGKIILASFTLKKSKASNEFRVATIHVFGLEGSVPTIKLSVAANTKGTKIKAKAVLRKVKKNE